MRSSFSVMHNFSAESSQILFFSTYTLHLFSFTVHPNSWGYATISSSRMWGKLLYPYFLLIFFLFCCTVDKNISNIQLSNGIMHCFFQPHVQTMGWIISSASAVWLYCGPNIPGRKGNEKKFSMYEILFFHIKHSEKCYNLTCDVRADNMGR